MSAVPELAPARAGASGGRYGAIADRLRYPLAVYLASRLLYLAVAVADLFIRGGSLPRELRNWDGKWYVLLAEHGYPHTLPTVYGAHGWSTLGFEPLYSILMWAGGVVLPRGVEASGLLISLLGGAIATVEISLLARRWWGESASRRGVVFFCFFPGTIVFSMVYTEGLTLALVAGALLCLEDRRWILAGLLAGAATAVEPVAFAIIPACAAASLAEVWRQGRLNRAALRSLWAPLLSPWGAIATGGFLWYWTGTPLATFDTQRIAWGEHSSPLALYTQTRKFVDEFVHWQGIGHIDLNLPTGVIGAAFLAWALWQLWRLRDGLRPLEASAGAPVGLTGAGVSLGALVWTAFVALLTVTSDQTPPNPRLLICAFPVLLAVAAPRTGARRRRLLTVSILLLIGMSIGTFVGGGLRP
jgi:hypothetical protein